MMKLEIYISMNCKEKLSHNQTDKKCFFFTEKEKEKKRDNKYKDFFTIRKQDVKRTSGQSRYIMPLMQTLNIL